MANKEIVEIEFKGDSKTLTQAIDQLDKATKKLLNTQAKIIDFNKKSIKSTSTLREANRKLFLEIKSKGLKSIKDLNLSTKTLTDAYTGNKFAIRKVREELKKYNIQQSSTNKGVMDLTDGNRILGGSFAVLRSKMLLFNFAMGLGVRQLMKFAESASQVNSMERAFNTLQGGTANASIAINELKKATDGTMSSFDLFKQANNAMILGVTKNSTEMAQMFDIAQRLGRALGQDTASSVESLITGIGRQSRLMLDNIGIIVKADEAYASYAEKLNTTSDKLTDAQKKTAFFEATMESARSKVNSLGNEVLTSQDTLNQLQAQVRETTDAIGNALMPVITTMAEIMRAGAVATEGFFNAIADLTTVGGNKQGLEKLNEDILMLEISLEQFKSDNLVNEVTNIKNGLFEAEEGVRVFENTLASEIQGRDFATEAETIAKALDTLIAKRDKLQAPQEEDLTDKIKKDLEEAMNMFLEDGDTRRERNKAINKELAELNKQAVQDQKDAENSIRKVFGHTVQFKLDELSKERDEYIKHHGMSEEAEKIFYEKRNKIIEDAEKKAQQIKEKVKKANEKKENELLELKNILRDNARLDELEAIDAQAQLMRDAGLDEIAIKQFVADKKEEIDEKYRKSEVDKIKESAKSQLDQFKVVLDFGKKITSQLEKNLDSQVTNELEALKKTDAYKKASSEQRKTMETQVNNKFAQERKKLFEYNKGVSMAEAMITIAEKIIEYIDNPLMQIAIGALGAVQLKAISSQKAPTYEQGGLVGGRRHSQGGTMIEAEKGEFVMSRSAVESIGVEAMNQINQGGGAGITVNVTAPLVDETVIDSIIPAIEKAQRLNLA